MTTHIIHPVYSPAAQSYGRPSFRQRLRFPQLDSPAQVTTHSTVFEDNKGCVDLIAAPTMKPRSRHIAIKYHHFCEYVRRGGIKIQWITTDKQLADIVTKPLPLGKFEYIRQQLLGW